VTLDRYTHWIASMGRHAANSMDEALALSLLLTKPRHQYRELFVFATFAVKIESRRADSNRFPLLITSDASSVAGVCRELQIALI